MTQIDPCAGIKHVMLGALFYEQIGDPMHTTTTQKHKNNGSDETIIMNWGREGIKSIFAKKSSLIYAVKTQSLVQTHTEKFRVKMSQLRKRDTLNWIKATSNADAIPWHWFVWPHIFDRFFIRLQIIHNTVVVPKNSVKGLFHFYMMGTVAAVLNARLWLRLAPSS